MSHWDRITANRIVLADYLDTMSPDEWSAKSLCADWTNKQVALHLLVSPTMSKGAIFLSFLKSGFNLDKMSATLVKKMDGEMSAQHVASLTRSTSTVQSAPPGLKPIGVLGEVIVHGADIATVVGRRISFAQADIVTALDHFKGVQPILGCKKRIEGLQLKATDTNWSTGSGPAVEGTALDLLLAMTGRKQAADQLSGDGVSILRTR